LGLAAEANESGVFMTECVRAVPQMSEGLRDVHVIGSMTCTTHERVLRPEWEKSPMYGQLKVHIQHTLVHRYRVDNAS
jgi:hypothetical protein